VFFFTYLRRELRRRMRQTIVTALGLALGIGCAALMLSVRRLSDPVFES